jgi:transposase-like protein
MALDAGGAMEHRRFGKLLKQLEELTAAQAEKVLAALRQQGAQDSVRQIIEQRQATPKCPHCGAAHIRRYGKEHGLQRYRCVDCGRTFNALTGTPLARLRKKECWSSFTGSLQQSHSVREAARRAGVAKNTSFRWRHRFLQLDKDALKQTLSGIVEIDESFILESRKGERGLPREARKRGGKAKKPGLSDEQTPVLIARDRQGGQIEAVLPNRTTEAVEAALDGVLFKNDVLLCVDGDAAVIAYAKKHGVEFETIIASRGEHVHEKVLHVQNVNAAVSRFKQWLARFNGVASKYLPNYLAWRRRLETGQIPLAAPL